MQPAHSTVCAAVSQMKWKSFWTIPKDFILNGFSLPLHLINLPYEGGGCKFCPDAKPDDDLLDFIVIANVPKIIALAILPTVFSGKHTRLPGVHIFRCKKAEVHSKIALPVHSDGEPIYLQKDVSFSLEPETLKIIT